MIEIQGSVGAGATNRVEDVRVVQQALQRIPAAQGGTPGLAVDGRLGPRTRNAITRFQLQQLRWTDGSIEPGRVTMRCINALLTPGTPRPPVPLLPPEVLALPSARAPNEQQRRRMVAALDAAVPRGRVLAIQGDVAHGGREGRVAAVGRFLYANDHLIVGSGGMIKFEQDGEVFTLPPNCMVIVAGHGTSARRAGLEAELETGRLRERLAELRGLSPGDA